VALGEVFAPISAICRLLSLLVNRRPSHPDKSLQARIIDRAIVAELPPNFPLYISDEAGKRYRGVYIIGLLIWNRGNQPIVDADFPAAAPLLVKIGEDATLISARIVPVEDQTVASATTIDEHSLSIKFDCINPTEYLIVSIFVTGNPLTGVQITGRIIGQSSPIDYTAEEGRAPFGERLVAFFLLIFILGGLPGFVGGGYLILRDYGINSMFSNPENIPRYLLGFFMLGVMWVCTFTGSRIMYWIERRRHPPGYPLRADLEPSLLETIKGLFLTLFKARKQRVFVSLLDWGKPVIMEYKKIRRRTIDDWIR
jgi:hypothetical protein